MSTARMRLASGSALLLCSFAMGQAALAQDGLNDEVFDLGTVVLTAEEQIKQALGTSTVTEGDIERLPVVNDVAEIIRKMPGVNLSGTSSTGQRGNQRQVDIRGMGPENVLILIDGKPVLSRMSVKQGRSSERDSRGDTNWVPPEMIDSIEVIRGPAAARYGSGAAGGVINIVTKAPDEDFLQVGTSFDSPQSDDEGMTQRYNLLWAKRLNDEVALRFSANYNKTDADSYDINESEIECTTEADGTESCTAAQAGTEGVVNRDYALRLDWAPSAANQFNLELGYSRQGNIYAGDSQLGNGQFLNVDPESLVDDGTETNSMERRTVALTHIGSYGWGDTNSFVQFERTDNRRLSEGPAGRYEGSINSSDSYDEAVLTAVSGKSEAYVGHSIGGRAAELTMGVEVRYEELDLSGYNSFSSLVAEDGSIDTSDGDPLTSQMTVGLYVEDNIIWNDSLTLTPSLRFDHADTFGGTWSGGLNASYALNSAWTIKGGVAKAYKAPTVYQMAENYVYVSSGNGCPYPYYGDGPCYVMSNDDLEPETSINKEIGIQYQGSQGINATLTYFHNDYRNKIQSGVDQIATLSAYNARYDIYSDSRIFQWDNIPESEVSGLEGSFAWAFAEDFNLTVNGTYMLTSKQKLEIDGGTTSDGTAYGARTIEVPLSLVPKYTVNAALDWYVNDRFTLTPSLTHYGPTDAPKESGVTGYDNDDSDDDRDPYTLVNIGMNYRFDNGIDLKAGVTNAFDTQVLRSGSGAQTYNEPGRAFYLGVTKTF